MRATLRAYSQTATYRTFAEVALFCLVGGAGAGDGASAALVTATPALQLGLLRPEKHSARIATSAAHVDRPRRKGMLCLADPRCADVSEGSGLASTVSPSMFRKLMPQREQHF